MKPSSPTNGTRRVALGAEFDLRARYGRHDGPVRVDRASQLSASGLFVHTAAPSPIGHQLDIVLLLSGERTIRTRAMVVYCNPRGPVPGSVLPQGMVVTFAGMADSERGLAEELTRQDSRDRAGTHIALPAEAGQHAALRIRGSRKG